MDAAACLLPATLIILIIMGGIRFQATSLGIKERLDPRMNLPRIESNRVNPHYTVIFFIT